MEKLKRILMFLSDYKEVEDYINQTVRMKTVRVRTLNLKAY